jgi:crotonobetainyl-CoA:carnitine CoA-transferase CaiB-like acyl-CoA transferase
MTAIMKGVRVLEVAEHTFVPAASALLADWGAEVIKIEHVERGDTMRGLASTGTAPVGGGVHVLLEHSNRGKHSLALDLTTERGLKILYELAATCDIFLTNKLPSVRTKLRIDVEDVRAQNPNIIYARGAGQGETQPARRSSWSRRRSSSTSSRPSPAALPSSTSTATRSSPSSGTTGTPSSPSRQGQDVDTGRDR